MRRRALVACLVLALTGPAEAGSKLAPECPLAEARPDTTALILWVGEERMTSQGQGLHALGPIRAVARLRRERLEPTDGENLREGMRVWKVLDPSDSGFALAGISSFLDRLGKDHCVYSAELRPSQPVGTLLSSARLPGMFRPPSAQDRAFFREQNATCVEQGDSEPAKCARPELVAISDVDANGQLEYWATQPYAWDTGLAIWQRTAVGLEVLFEVCPGCSD